MTVQARSARAIKLQADLHTAAATLIAVLERIEPDRWTHVPGPSVWSVGKDAAHVADAAVYHQWIIRLTIGQKVPSRRPAIERQELTTAMTVVQAVDLVRRRTDEGAALISGLSDEQLALPTRPPRARAQALADTIELVLIGHYDTHRRAIERKLRDGPDRTVSLGFRAMADALGPLAALGRTASDRTLLDGAMRSLNASHGLASKIGAQPNLAAIMKEFVIRLLDAFGSLSAIDGRAALDIACGSSSSRSPVTGRQTPEFEPWMCRLLLELGAQPTGLDIGDNAGETFIHHRVDLAVAGALDFLATGSFDAVHESRLFGSPEFRAAHGDATEGIRREIHLQERRLLRPGGILIHSDGRPGHRRTRHVGRS